jgi:hypothetical protein
VQRFLCVSCGHTVSVLPGIRLTYRPLEVGRLRGFFDAQARVSCGLDPPPGVVEAGCLHRAWDRLLTRVDVLKDAFGQLLASELYTAEHLWKELRRGVGSAEDMLRFLAALQTVAFGGSCLPTTCLVAGPDGAVSSVLVPGWPWRWTDPTKGKTGSELGRALNQEA